MAVYSYQATNSDGRTIRGSIAADTARQARDMLRERGLDVRKMVAEQARGKSWWVSRALGFVGTGRGCGLKSPVSRDGVAIHLLGPLMAVVRASSPDSRWIGCEQAL